MKKTEISRGSCSCLEPISLVPVLRCFTVVPRDHKFGYVLQPPLWLLLIAIREARSNLRPCLDLALCMNGWPVTRKRKSRSKDFPRVSTSERARDRASASKDHIEGVCWHSHNSGDGRWGARAQKPTRTARVDYRKTTRSRRNHNQSYRFHRFSAFFPRVLSKIEDDGLQCKPNMTALYCFCYRISS